MQSRITRKLLLIALAIGMLNIAAFAQTTSLLSGDWHDPATWSTGLVPTAADDVLISAGHVVALAASGECRDLGFGDDDAKLDLADAAALLSIHGDFTTASTSHNAFAGWIAGAVVRFTGTEPIQKISGLTTSSTVYATRFHELVVDKAEGKVTTGDDLGIGNDCKLMLGYYLDIQSGTFELAEGDDIEGRDLSGTATTPDITVRAGASFEMIGRFSHIRRGNFIGEDSSKIGTLQVWGSVGLACRTTNRLNFTAIVIEDGGLVQFPLGRGTLSNRLNPGTVTVNAGGVFKNNLTTQVWYENTTTPNGLDVRPGGEFFTASSTTPLPQFVILDGDVRFGGVFDQTIPAGLPPIGGTLFLTNEGVKTLEGDLTVDGGLLLYGQAGFSTGGFALTYGPTAFLQYGDSGQFSPQITTDEEFPATGGPLDVIVHNEGGVTLHADRTIAGALTVVEGNLLTGGFEITLDDAATLAENESATVLGLVRATRTLGAGAASDFGGLGLQIAAGAVAPGQTTVVRRTGAGLADFGLGRHYDIAADLNAGLDATLTVGYGDWELGLIPEANLALCRSLDDGVYWDLMGGVVDPVGKTVTLAGVDSFSLWALADTLDPVSIGGDPEDGAGETADLPRALAISNVAPNPFNPSTTIHFDLPRPATATLAVHDVRGRLVRTLWHGGLEAGRHPVSWDGRDDQGGPAASGLYLVRLVTDDGQQRAVKITLSK